MEKLTRTDIRKIAYAGKEVFAKVVRRNFEAAKYPIGSLQRKELNQSFLTSEYYPSKKYAVAIVSPYLQCVADFRTKKEAEYCLESRAL